MDVIQCINEAAVVYNPYNPYINVDAVVYNPYAGYKMSLNIKQQTPG